jgi:hypothetical protein
MAANATFQQGYGLNTVLVAASVKADDTVIRDGKTDIVTSVASASTGIYVFTLAKKFPQMVAGTASITPADATPTDIVCDVAYDASAGTVTVYTRAAATLTDPEAGSRVNFIAVFCTKDALKDA